MVKFARKNWPMSWRHLDTKFPKATSKKLWKLLTKMVSTLSQTTFVISYKINFKLILLRQWHHWLWRYFIYLTSTKFSWCKMFKTFDGLIRIHWYTREDQVYMRSGGWSAGGFQNIWSWRRWSHHGIYTYRQTTFLIFGG